MNLKRRLLNYIYAFIIVIFCWYIISYISKISIIPSPFIVFKNLAHIFIDKIAIHTTYSILRILSGIALSLLIGIPAGLLMGYNDKIDKLLSPIVYFIYPVPKIALLPVVMLIFGLGEFSKILMIALIVVFQNIVAVRDATKGIQKELYYSIKSLGGTWFQLFKEVIIPCVLPELLTSIRVALGTAISVLFFTETFGTEYGLGYFIMDSWTRVNYIEMYSGIIVLSVIGITLFTLIDLLETVFCRWR